MSGSMIGMSLMLDGAVNGNPFEQAAGLIIMNDQSSRNRAKIRQREFVLRDREQNVDWRDKRSLRTSASRDILARAEYANKNDAFKILQDLQNITGLYEVNLRYLDYSDRRILDQLRTMSAKFEENVQAQIDNNMQEKIHTIIGQVFEMLNQGDIPGALKGIINARGQSLLIKDIRNIQNQIRTIPDDFIIAIEFLKQQKLEFESRAVAISTAIADEILNNVNANLRTKDGSNGILYSPHASMLKDKLRVALIQSWSKFDRRDIPNTLKESLEQIISSKSKDIGNKKYIYDLCRSNISIDQIEIRLKEIDAEVAKYLPKQQPPHITLRIGGEIYMSPRVCQKNAI